MADSKITVTGDLERLPAQDSNISVADSDSKDVQIVLTQAFGPNGDNLVGISDVTFDGHPAVTLQVEAGDHSGLVHLSPIHGDSRKAGLTDIPLGTRCVLRCPVSGDALPLFGDVEGSIDAAYYQLYLTPKLSDRSVALISNVWGHYNSRIVDEMELISSWADEAEGLRG